MAQVFLVRHGEAAATWGDANADPGLSDLGRSQAEAVSHAILRLKPSAIVTSPMRRCRETAAPFASLSGMEPLVVPGVSEIPSPSDLPGHQRTEWLRRAFAGNWGEIEGANYAAWRDAVADCVAGRGNAVIFTHFVAINAAVSAATGSDRVVVFRPANTSLTILETDGRRLSLVELGLEAEGAVL